MREKVLSLTTSRRSLAAFSVWIAFAALLALAAFSTTAEADHRWSNYHWKASGSTIEVPLGDNLTSGWDGYLRTTAGADDTLNKVRDWNDEWDDPDDTPDTGKFDALNTPIVAGKTNNTSGTRTPKKCAPTSGRVEVCNAAYGNNGWLGLAQIWANGNEIVQGTAKLNDSYFGSSTYNTPGWKNLVMCQEVGHTFGLGHVNENKSDPNTGSCMDYSSDPDGTRTDGGDPWGALTNEYPNEHDYELLKAIYGPPSTTTTTPGTTSAASDFPAEANRGDLNSRADWGQLKQRSADGAVEIYERDFGNGKKVITRVIRAIEKTPTVEASERGPAHDDGHTHDDGEAH